MPFANFDMIRNENDLLRFFDEYFADAVALMGKDLLVNEYFKNPKGSLIMIRVMFEFELIFALFIQIGFLLTSSLRHVF